MYRYAGGHIHVGMSSNYIRANSIEYKIAKTEAGHIRAIKMFDYMTGAIMVMTEKGAASKRRRASYGSAGCFRPTPYGVEYRTPSCMWMKSPLTMSLIFGLVRLAWNLIIEDLDEEFVKLVGYSHEDVRGIINESDTVAAKKFLKTAIPYISIISTSNHNPLSILSLRTSKNGYLDSPTEAVKNISAGKEIFIRGGGKPVFTLPAFLYMLKRGFNSFIDTIDNEWNFKKQNSFYTNNGIANCSYVKLEKNTDFEKFQKNFLTNTI